jgi:hypothetical protein
MSYDKYIKYKNKYLQLKAKYTQVGGAGMWTIFKTEKQLTTTPITQEESDALNAIIQFNKGMELNFDSSVLRDKRGQSLTNKHGDMKYIYIINADGKTGKRTSINGEYDMIFIPDDTSGASALPQSRAPPPPPPASAPPSSASGAPPQPQRAYPPSTSYRSASGAPPQRASTSTPPPPYPQQRAYPPHPSAPLLSPDKLGQLPLYMSNSSIVDAEGISKRVLTVRDYDIGFLQTNEKIDKDGIVFTKINEALVNMEFRGQIYPLSPTNEASVWVYYY